MTRLAKETVIHRDKKYSSLQQQQKFFSLQSQEIEQSPVSADTSDQIEIIASVMI